MKQIVMAITGASGAVYARKLAQALAAQDLHLHLMASPPGREVLADELGIARFTAADLLGYEAGNVTLYNHRDVGARPASGSFLTDGMVICPCSAHSLAAVANGLADSLITRAAMVTLKERRRLVLVLREMPLSVIECENMLRVAQAGAIVCPASPGFYMQPATIDDLVNFVVGRVLDLLGLPHTLNTRWNPAQRPTARTVRGTADDAS